MVIHGDSFPHFLLRARELFCFFWYVCVCGFSLGFLVRQACQLQVSRVRTQAGRVEEWEGGDANVLIGVPTVDEDQLQHEAK